MVSFEIFTGRKERWVNPNLEITIDKSGHIIFSKRVWREWVKDCQFVDIYTTPFGQIGFHFRDDQGAHSYKLNVPARKVASKGLVKSLGVFCDEPKKYKLTIDKTSVTSKVLLVAALQEVKQNGNIITGVTVPKEGVTA